MEIHLEVLKKIELSYYNTGHILDLFYHHS